MSLDPPDIIGVNDSYTAKAELDNTSGSAVTVTSASWRTWLDDGNQKYGDAGDKLNGSVHTIASQSISANSTYDIGSVNGAADNSHAFVCTEIFGITVPPGVTLPPAPYKKCVPIAARPYFSVLGGDVAAGAGFGGAGVAGASIIGSNNDSTPANTYDGASAQLAALALGQIKSFATGEAQNGGAGTPWVNSLGGGSYSPSELAFANTSPNPPTYGGGFGQPNWAVQNYYSTVSDGTTLTSAPTAVGGLAGGNYSYTGNVSLGASTIAADGRKVVLKVKGNVYISGSITYASAATIRNIPQFQLIVSGNIYVDGTVGELDGFYVAQGNTGIFASCADSSGPLYGKTNIANCDTQLVVNGAVAAQKLILNRTDGDISGGFGSPKEPGELIRFSPQLWLPSFTGGSGVSGWQSVTSLPPIL